MWKRERKTVSVWMKDRERVSMCTSVRDWESVCEFGWMIEAECVKKRLYVWICEWKCVYVREREREREREQEFLCEEQGESVCECEWKRVYIWEIGCERFPTVHLWERRRVCMCVCVCMCPFLCTCEWGREGETLKMRAFMNERVWEKESESVHEYICVGERERERERVCVCVCVCVWERVCV